MCRIRAVIFDMDGVLIDAKLWHYEALNRALEHYGHTITWDAHRSLYDGLPTRKKLRLLSSRQGLPTNLHDDVCAKKQKYTLAMARARCAPIADQQFMLQSLRRSGYKIAVASNSVRATVDLMLAQANVLEFCAFTLSNEDVDHPKPHPAIYEKAIERLGLSPEECLVVEDHPYGVKAATAAGASVLEVATVGEVPRRVLALLAELGQPILPSSELPEGRTGPGQTPPTRWAA